MAKKPTREYFGFSQFYVTTFTLCFVFVWSLLPNLKSYANSDGPLSRYVIGFAEEIVDLLPQRYWIIVTECTILMGMLVAYLGILFYNEDVLTVPLDDIRTVTDSKANIAKPVNYQNFLENHAFKETSGVIDLPITEVCRLLYEYKDGGT